MASTSPTAAHRLRYIILAIGMLTLANLACFTFQQTIIYDADGSGRGVVLLEMTYPHDTTNNPNFKFGDSAEIKKGLVDKGWESVEVTEVDAAHYLATAKYTFGNAEGEKALSDVVPGYTLKIEEAANGYKYYTFEGVADYSDLENFWNTVQNDCAVNGIKSDTDLFGSGNKVESDIPASEIQSMIKTYGPPSATLRVILPGQTPVDAKDAWDNEQDFMTGKTDMLTFTWAPGSRAKAPLMVERRLEPLTTVTAEEAQAQIGKLTDFYVTAIPSGKSPLIKWWSGPLAGHINNNLAAAFNGGNYTCSSYQGMVLNWLDSIRTNPNESVHNLLNGLDYGPIETQGGGHRAVVLFPRGTDWHTTGIVLDPWPYQEPRAFPIGSWNLNLWGVSEEAKWPYPDSDAGKLYPQLIGKTPSYPASAILQGDLGKGLAKPVRVLLVRSPVNVLVTFTDGRRIGTLVDGTPVNDFGNGASFYALPKDGAPNETESYMFLPGGDFSVQLNGTGTGDFHTVLASPDKYTGFGSQPITLGQTATFSTDTTGQASALTLPNGSVVQPVLLSAEQLDDALDVHVGIVPASSPIPNLGLGQGTVPDTNAPISNLPANVNMQTLIWGGLICLGLVGLAVVGVGTLLGARWLMTRNQSSTAPAVRSSSPKQARLSIEGPEGQRDFVLPPLRVSIGRTPENGLVLPSPNVSRQHAKITYEQGRYLLHDLGSANGLTLNGRKITKPTPLSYGDVIQIQPYTIRFKLS
jgi:FHA domain